MNLNQKHLLRDIRLLEALLYCDIRKFYYTEMFACFSPIKPPKGLMYRTGVKTLRLFSSVKKVRVLYYHSIVTYIYVPMFIYSPG